MSNQKLLEQRGRGWYCVKDVPRPLREKLGKKRFVKSLQTRDFAIAMGRRHAALAEFQREIDAAKARGTADAAHGSAFEWREVWAATPEAGREEVLDFVRDEAEAIEEKYGHPMAQEFFDLATGKATPLLHYIEQWLAEGGDRGPATPRTQLQYRTDLVGLEKWSSQASVPLTIEAFTRKVAGRYVTEALVAAHVHPKTANRKISAASAYWKWLVKRGHVEENPWRGQSLAKQPRRGEDGGSGKRSFTTEEVRKLLSGSSGEELGDAMRVAALSGMRIDEIYRLTVADCADGLFNIRRSKTEAGVRKVPIHPDLVGIVARRVSGEGADAYLFDEAGGAPKVGRERSQMASKRFGLYRDRLGLTERHPGARQAAADFHSWRRWFITEAERAGQPPHIIAAVVGHLKGREGMTLTVYSDGPSAKQHRACVEAVRLPDLRAEETGTI